ncbi:hypothetical protein Tco_0859007 [Tanacetum coccineum]|uniref:Uncharacterized protein n=1 Tax=Tanacetum coccineum TaxID=301880 RepID=A0ABQ5BAW5_9ASTR
MCKVCKVWNPGDGPYCHGCALLRKKFKEDLFTYCVENEFFEDLQDTSESSDDNTNVVNAPQETFVSNQDPGENSSPSPPHIDHCCHECGDSLDGIFCRQCTCKSCGKGAHYGYNCHYGKSFQSSIIRNHAKIKPLVKIYKRVGKKEKRMAEEQAAKERYWKIPICDDDDDDYTIAITPVLPTKEPVNSLSMGDEHLDTIPATESDEVIKSSVENLVPIPSESEGIPDSVCDVPLCNNPTPLEYSFYKEHLLRYSSIPNDDSTSRKREWSRRLQRLERDRDCPEIVSLEVVEIVIPEVGGIDTDILLTIKDDILREKLLNVNLLIANIEALKDNPAPSSDVMTKSSSTSLNLFLEETNTFDNSSPESETFCFDLEEISSGSTTTHADFSKYDSFIFDLSINPFPPADRSDFYHEEFADGLAHIISPPEYDHFCFKIEPELGNLTMDVVNDIFPTREPRVHVPNVLPTHPILNLDFILLSEPLFAYIVWIFLPFLTYPVAPPYLLSCGNEDTIFDPGISIYHSFMPDVSHRSGTFMKFNVYPNHLNESPMKILSSTCSPMDQ